MVVRRLTSCAVFASSLTFGAAVAQAPVPSAIVEEVESTGAGVQTMDYVVPGTVLRLAANERVVLSYLRSCWREHIVEGTITIGIQQSEVRDGKVERVKVACDSGHISLSREQARVSGAMAFRDAPKKGSAVKPEATIYGLSPIIEAKSAGRLEIDRLDHKEFGIALDISAPLVPRDAFVDLAKVGKTLTAGGIYRARLGDQQIVFKVDAAAKPGAATVVGRLLRLRPNT